MKRITVAILFVIYVVIALPQQQPTKRSAITTFSSIPQNTVLFNPTKFKIYLNNLGSLDWNNFFWPAYFYFDGEYQQVEFDHALWVVGKYGGEPRLALGEWGSQYSPGPIIDGRPAVDAKPQDSSRYRAYKISRGDNQLTNKDYAEWPADLGAPFSVGKPRLYGDQTVWMVFNALDTNVGWWRNNAGHIRYLPPIPLEIRHLVYSLDHDSLLSNVVFFEWKIINKGLAVLDSAYISLWTDIDFCDAVHNTPAVDTINQLGYCWNKIDESVFCTFPPAVGYVLMYGPAVPSLNDTATSEGRKIPGKTNLPMSSFWGFQDDSFPEGLIYGPAWDLTSAWNNARGLTPKGQQVIDSVTKKITKFPFSGDPVSNSGWLFDAWTSGGAGFNMYSGPFTMQPGDTQWVMMALVVGVGNDRYGSINELRRIAKSIRSIPYQQLSLTSVGDSEPQLPALFVLSQNFPNPFNPSTQVRFSTATFGFVSLKVYDVLGREVATLVNEPKPAGTYTVSFDASHLATGVYFYQLHAGNYLETKKMILMK